MIDPNFAPPGFVAVASSFFKDSEFKECEGCAFSECDNDVCSAIWENIASCCGEYRPDGEDVIFVVRTQSQPATANFPCDDMGAPV